MGAPTKAVAPVTRAGASAGLVTTAVSKQFKICSSSSGHSHSSVAVALGSGVDVGLGTAVLVGVLLGASVGIGVSVEARVGVSVVTAVSLSAVAVVVGSGSSLGCCEQPTRRRTNAIKATIKRNQVLGLHLRGSKSDKLKEVFILILYCLL